MRPIPKLVLKSAKAAATTYSFETEGDGFKSWALCTVNDQTGELLITSDWGSWSHRWHASPEVLGAPTLTAFIGDRGDVDYLARKLQKEGRNGTCFSSDKTAHELKRLLCARRLEDGREQLADRLEPEEFGHGCSPNHGSDRYTVAGLPLFSHRTVPAPTWQDSTRTERLPYLTAEKARELWDAIEELVNECSRSSDLFWERLPAIPGFTDYVTDEPWQHGQTEQTPEDKALRDIVLPALIKACKSMVKHREHLARIPALEDENKSEEENAMTMPTGLFAVGDHVVHTKSKREGKVRNVRACPDGSVEMQVDIDFDDVWWNSRHVKKINQETPT